MGHWRKRFFVIFSTEKVIRNFSSGRARLCRADQVGTVTPQDWRQPDGSTESRPTSIIRSLKTECVGRMIWMKNWPRLIGKVARAIQQIVFVAAILLCAGACAGPTKSLYPPRAGETPRRVYVINHGALHTGLAVKRSDIPRGAWPANRDYSGFKYLEVGWGDDDAYRKPLTSGTAMKALAGSKRTVLLSDGFSTLRARLDNPKFSIVEVDLSAGGFAQLCQHIEQTYALDEAGQPIRLGKGWYQLIRSAPVGSADRWGA